MYLLDSNILLYAHLNNVPEYESVSSWLERILNDGDTVLITESVLLSFIRLTTNPKICQPGLTIKQCEEIIKNLFAFEKFILHQPEQQHYL